MELSDSELTAQKTIERWIAYGLTKKESIKRWEQMTYTPLPEIIKNLIKEERNECFN